MLSVGARTCCRSATLRRSDSPSIVSWELRLCSSPTRPACWLAYVCSSSRDDWITRSFSSNADRRCSCAQHMVASCCKIRQDSSDGNKDTRLIDVCKSFQQTSEKETSSATPYEQGHHLLPLIQCRGSILCKTLPPKKSSGNVADYSVQAATAMFHLPWTVCICCCS